jgi:hypothetical protein
MMTGTRRKKLVEEAGFKKKKKKKKGSPIEEKGGWRFSGREIGRS